ncbi:MAG TPA: hypothetical protein VFB00_08135 [Terriglobales bacterium]|nr:hypothetical protein [Terriglobales bacterium]
MSFRLEGLYVKLTVTVRLLVRLLIVHTAVPLPPSQPTQLAEVALPVGVAVIVIAEPGGKLLLHVVAQPSPGGVLEIVPVPMICAVKTGFPPPPALKQTTFAVMKPVTIAPDDDRFPVLLLVCTVAETRALPQARPVAVNTPFASTVTI